ncbi:MAG: protein kinase [Planctomycetes bacterium]|nr:protein kinase [Planctomycetota bacterium]
MASPPLRPGDVAGGYRALSLLGRGGSAAVYLARRIAGDSLVVLKVIPDEVAGSDRAVFRRFAREVEILGRLDHPHVVRILGPLERLDRAWFFPLEYVPGTDLANLLSREGPLSPARAADFARQIGSGLAAVHEAGVLHRDLKPANVMVQEAGGIKIVDFGLGVAGDLTRLTATGAFLGTPDYMAPEQLDGRTDLDPRADQYAFGALVYEMLAGTVPFPRSTIEALVAARANEPPRPPSAFRPGLDPAWDAWTLRALAFRPEDRFASVAAAVEALPEPAGQPATPEPDLAATTRSGRIGAAGEPTATGRTGERRPPDPTLASPATPPGAPERLGRYEVLRELGRGATGTVYLVRDPELDRLVALKLLRQGPGATDARATSRFRDEARAAGAVRHPNLVLVHEAGEVGGVPYFTMDYVEGRSLADRLRQAAGPLPAREAVGIVVEVARALGAVHAAGLVHRDVKPGNILLDLRGAGHLSDFGAARSVHEVERTRWTRPGALVGTPSYASPEQWSSASAGPASDVWSLGVVLYQSIAGRLPFAEAAILPLGRSILLDDPVRPSRVAPGVHRDLDTICLACLEKDPGKRYRDGNELAADLERFLEGAPIEFRRAAPFRRLMSRARRHRFLTAAVASAAAGVLALAAYVAAGAWRDRTRVETALQEGRTALDRGDLEGAAGRFRFVLDLDPGNDGAREGILRVEDARSGRALDRTRERAAEEEARALLEGRRAEFEELLSRGVARLLVLAVQRLRHPASVLAAEARAVLPDLERALALDGTSARAWWLAGLGLWFEGESPRAREAFGRALALDPADAVARALRIAFLVDLYRSRVLDRHVRLGDGRTGFLFPAPFAATREDEELASLDRALAEDLDAYASLPIEATGEGDAAYAGALRAYFVGEFDLALERLAASAAADPIFSLDEGALLEAEIRWIRGELMERRPGDRGIGGLRRLEILVQGRVRDFRIVEELALGRASAGFHDQAIEGWRRAFSDYPEHRARAYSRAVSTRASQGKFAAAIALCQEFLSAVVPGAFANEIAGVRRLLERVAAGDEERRKDLAGALRELARVARPSLAASDAEWFETGTSDLARAVEGR